jgi:1,4-dihydroxy-2-naphthoate octaprenyltransferase
VSLLVHLRLHFQLLLAPVFLWGWLLARGGLTTGVLLAFVAFHVFLYGGATAFNSYYDRDQGPVGGLEHPPPVVAALLPFSLAVKAAGWLLSLAVGSVFCAIYSLFALLSVAYSHPRLRLKAHPIGSLTVVGLGQGVLAFLGAWVASSADLGSAWSPDGVLGALAATLLILALYPLTQLYQVEEDRARHDRTLAVAWGARRCFAFCLACTAIGGGLMVGLLVARFGLLDLVLVGGGLLAQLGAIAWWARRYEPADVLGNYRLVMRLNTLSAAALSAYLLVRIAHA